MKRTIKYIIASIAISTSALMSGGNAIAQNLPANVYLEKDGICFRKTATQDETNASIYHIDLEAFVKGNVTYTESADSSDIVLVLDVSGSMTDAITSYEYSVATTPTSVTWNNRSNYLNSTTESNQRFVKYGDDYYRVYVGSEDVSSWWSWGSDYRYFLYFQVGNAQYYINTSGQIVTDMPTDVNSGSTNLLASNVQLYSRVTVSSTTKIQALKDASLAFITAVAKNAKFDKRGAERETPLNHRIAIVKFANASYYSGNSQYEPVGNGLHKGADNNNNYNYTEVVRGLESVLTDSTDLKSAINGLSAGGATAADYGMTLAKNIIDHIDANHSSNKTVVFFTDGAPTHESDFNTTVARNAIANSNSIKALTYGSGDDATHPSVFSVGVFDTKPTVDTDIYRFMDRVSSNFLNATTLTNGTRSSSEFYKDASGGAADLTAIFKAIANSASTPGSTIGTSSAVTVDVVTNSFSIPANAQDAKLEVLVAPCIGEVTYTADQVGEKYAGTYLKFGNPVSPTGVLGMGTITPTVDSTANTVSTTGFDFSANFCGPDNSTIPPTYRGYKQIIRFEITVKDDAVGGPNVATNDSKSGIYVDGTQIAEFNRPTVKLPVQIWIQKNGLQGEDSAVFTLARAPYSPDFDPKEAEWESITKIVVGPDDYDPETGFYLKKQIGLNPDYFYRIKEDAWAFGYQYQDGGILYTVGDEVVNPFVFDNTPKNKKFDEAQARNIFKEKTQ